jgi:hypothetical protein
MSELHTLYEQLTRSIDDRMPSLVASLVPFGAISRAVEGTNESPTEVAGKGPGTVTNLSQACNITNHDRFMAVRGMQKRTARYYRIIGFCKRGAKKPMVQQNFVCGSTKTNQLSRNKNE